MGRYFFISFIFQLHDGSQVIGRQTLVTDDGKFPNKYKLRKDILQWEALQEIPKENIDVKTIVVTCISEISEKDYDEFHNKEDK